MKLAALALAFAAACGSSAPPTGTGPTTPTRPEPTPATLPAGEVGSCGDACLRMAECWQLSYGETMPDADVASCESECLTLTPEDGDAYMERIAAETDCVVVVGM